MPLGPGALSLLLQPTHVQNPAGGDGMFKAAGLMQQRRRDDFNQEQTGREFEEGKRRFGIETDLAKGKFGLDVEKFDYQKTETKRIEKAKAWDDLLEADASQDPQKMLAAWNSARARGINVPGYEEKINELFKSGGSTAAAAETKAGEPAAAEKPLSKKDAGIDAGLDKVTSEVLPSLRTDKSPLPGESIGDGWDVVETPESAKAEPPQQRSPFTGQPLAEPQGLAPSRGLAGGLPPPRPQQPQMPPGSLIAYDEDTGKAIGTVNPETAMARSRARVREALSPLQEHAQTSAEKRAAAIAMDSGQRLVGTMPVDKIVENAQKRYDKELGRDTAKSVARGGKEAGSGEAVGGLPPDAPMFERAGRTPEEIRAIASIGNYVHTKIIQKAQAIHKTAEIQRIAGTAKSIASKVMGDKGFGQRQAIRDVLRMTEGARQTDADLNYALRGGGALGTLHMKLNEWVAGGTLPHNYKQQIADYATLLDGLNRQRQKLAADYAYEFAKEDTGLRDMVSAEDLEHWATQARRGAMGQSIAVPTKAADAEADALMGGD